MANTLYCLLPTPKCHNKFHFYSKKTPKQVIRACQTNGPLVNNQNNNNKKLYSSSSGTSSMLDLSPIWNNGSAKHADKEAPVDAKTYWGGLAESTLGRYLARRLLQVGVTDLFSVPGDSNLTLLDHLMEEPGLNLVGCCNELNAGYAADGYARSRGVGAVVLTFTVGGLSALNAVAGAYSESLPLICILGGPNSNYYGKNVVLHHTTGLAADFSQELTCFQAVTCYQAVVANLEEAQEKIDTAITKALVESKPVYISISCDLPGISHPSFARRPLPFFIPPRISNPLCLEAAVEAATDFLNKATKPVLIGGAKIRTAKAGQAFLQLANACGYATAVMPAAKGLVPENQNQFIGTYWGSVSSPFCAEIVESGDARLYVGPIHDDLATVGFTSLFNKDKTVIVQPNRVVIGNSFTFGGVLMEDFLHAMAKTLHRNTMSYENYKLIYVPKGIPVPGTRNEVLKINVLFKHIEKMLSHDSVVIAETGLTWFDCQKLKLPQGCGYESQMLYASIGWSVGATLGYALAAPDKRVITCIGDGSFQMAAQEVSTMIRCGQNNIIFLINNGGYTTEVQIHDGPYNIIKSWDYSGLVDAIWNRQGKCWTAKVCCEEELVVAIETAMGEQKESLCFIEVIVHKNDTSKELLNFGSRLAAANSSSPRLRN